MQSRYSPGFFLLINKQNIMKPLPFLATCLMFVLLIACSGGNKKILVMASGDIEVKDNTINLIPGTTHNTKEITVSDKVIVNSPAGNKDYTVGEDGLYILNLKKDTLVGSYQRLGSDNSQQVISRADLQKRIDSLTQLMAGTNVTTEGRNFSIAPNQLTKITSNTNAQIVGPYLKMPGSFEGGKEHEVYKFYTNKEMKEIIEKLKPMSVDSVKREE